MLECPLMTVSPLSVVIAYLVLTTLLGIALGRRAKTARDWAVAGGSMGTFMLAAAIAGTRIGGAGIYGVAGDVITGGVWNLVWYAASTFLALAIVGLWFAVPYRRLGLQTVGEAFTRRFGSRRGQALTSLCVQTEYLIVNVIEVYVTAALLRFMTGISVPVATLCAVAVLVSYTAFGGLWGAAYTNLVHCAVIVLGLGAVVILGTSSFGGWEAVTRAVATRLALAGRDEGAFWSIAGQGWAPVIAMIFSAAIHTPAASIYANFSTAARTERQLSATFLLAGLGASVMPALAGIVGILTLARYGAGRGLSGYATITTFATETSPWLGGLAIAAILAAVVSTGGPILLSSATLFVRDWLPARVTATPEVTLRAYRIATVVIGVLSGFLSLLVVKSGDLASESAPLRLCHGRAARYRSLLPYLLAAHHRGQCPFGDGPRLRCEHRFLRPGAWGTVGLRPLVREHPGASSGDSSRFSGHALVRGRGGEAV